MPEPQVVHKLIQPLPTKEEKNRDLILSDLILCWNSIPLPVLPSNRDISISTTMDDVTCFKCWGLWEMGIYR